MHNRNNAEWITHKEAPLFISITILIGTIVVGLLLWQVAAWMPNSEVGYFYSTPIITAHSFVKYFWVNLNDTMVTAQRGIIGILVGFFFVYPLGCLIAISGYFSSVGKLVIMTFLSIAQLTVIMTFLQFAGATVLSVYLIGLYIAFVKMLAFGYYNTMTFLRSEEYRYHLEFLSVSGFRRIAFYRTIVGPLLFEQRLSSLYILSATIWTTISFAESYVGGHIGGLGMRIQITSEQYGTLGWFYSVSIMLTALTLIGWLLIYILSVLYKRKSYHSKDVNTTY